MDIEFLADLVAKVVLGNQKARLLSHQKIPTPSSIVFRLEYAFDGSHKVLFVKVPAGGKDRQQAAQIIKRLKREFKLAKRVEALFESTPELQTVSPAAFIEEINGFVTWEVAGDSFQDLMSSKLRFRYGRQESQLNRLSGLAGEWLDRFHSLDLVEGYTDLRKDISEYCGGRLDALVNQEFSLITRSVADSVMNRISAWIDEALTDPNVRIVMCHNDFSPHNIIVTGDGICVLDFSFSSFGLPAFDVACFWHKLEDLKWSWLRGNKGLAAIQDHFLNAYGASFSLTSADVKLGLTRLVLSKMLTLLNSRQSRLDRRIENQRRYSSYLSLLESGFDR